MNIVTEHQNSLLKRKEITAHAEYDSNPGFAQTTKDVATHFKVSEDVVVVRRVGSHFGSSTFMIDAMVYDTAEQKEKIEPKKKEKK